jgi:hypothetical protein
MSLGVNSGLSTPTHNFQSFSQKITAGVFVPVENTPTLTSVSPLRQRLLDDSMAATFKKHQQEVLIWGRVQDRETQLFSEVF